MTKRSDETFCLVVAAVAFSIFLGKTYHTRAGKAQRELSSSKESKAALIKTSKKASKKSEKVVVAKETVKKPVKPNVKEIAKPLIAAKPAITAKPAAIAKPTVVAKAPVKEASKPVAAPKVIAIKPAPKKEIALENIKHVKYQVQTGDNLSGILARFGICDLWGEQGKILEATHLNPKLSKSNGNLIFVGQWVELPFRELPSHQDYYQINDRNVISFTHEHSPSFCRIKQHRTVAQIPPKKVAVSSHPKKLGKSILKAPRLSYHRPNSGSKMSFEEEMSWSQNWLNSL